jgi:hypothetical protein
VPARAPGDHPGPEREARHGAQRAHHRERLGWKGHAAIAEEQDAAVRAEREGRSSVNLSKERALERRGGEAMQGDVRRQTAEGAARVGVLVPLVLVDDADPLACAREEERGPETGDPGAHHEVLRGRKRAFPVPEHDAFRRAKAASISRSALLLLVVAAGAQAGNPHKSRFFRVDVSDPHPGIFLAAARQIPGPRARAAISSRA